jgi:type I restriction enzyme S subunit
MSITIAVAPPGEQEQIVKVQNEETGPLRAAIEQANREVSLLREYRTRLIADLVTGKLDVREAAAQLPDEDQQLPPIDESDDISDAEEDGFDDLDEGTEDPES